MNKFLDVWEPVLEKCELYYPHITMNMVDWYPSGKNEIIVELKSGESLIYNFNGNNFRKLNNANYDDIDETEDEWRSEFSDRLRNKMWAACMSNWRLSRITGISEVSLSKYINGHATPSSYNLKKIARALNCSYSELLERA